MCTAVAFYREGLYFGRNMDIDRPFGQKVVIAPRGYAFPYRCRAAQPLSYALIGMASVTDGVPLYAEAANECGLCMAGLYFPQSASYFPPGHAADGRVTLAPYELIPYLLGGCRDCAEALRLLSRVDLAAVPFREDLPVAPLHFFLADATGAFAAEWTKEGLAVLAPTIEFGQRLAKAGKKIWVRFVLVPGLTDSEENVENVARICETFGEAIEHIDVLGFHQLGRPKWHELRIPYPLEDAKGPSAKLKTRVKEQFERHGFVVY